MAAWIAKTAITSTRKTAVTLGGKERKAVAAQRGSAMRVNQCS